jgi:ADP-L-glycero-D-manno-heptose 6-epimerase
MKYLVTGGTGFIGSNLALTLLERGDTVFVTGQEPENIPEGAQYLGGGFSNLDWEKMGEIDAVFHQAANNDTTSTDRDEMFRVNVDGSRRLFEGAVNSGCKRIVYASSTAVYGNIPAPYREQDRVDPLNVYAESKVAVDEYVQTFAKEHPEVRIVGLRYCNVYGPGENRKGKRSSMIWQLPQQMISGNPKIFKQGEQRRDYIYVKDVVRANLLALEAKRSEIVNCAGGCATSFNELIEILNGVLGTSRTPEYVDNPYLTHYQNHTECDMSFMKEMTGFVPEFNIRQGIEDYHAIGRLL